jgi:hypothetical protein
LKKESAMNRDPMRLAAVVIASLAGITASAIVKAQVVTTHLVGYQETPATLNSTGSATFEARISEDGTSIQYELSYGGFSTPVSQAHIHFGRPATSGGVALFLCSNLGNGPAGTPACPAAPATVTGTLTAADVVAIPAQGIDSGAAGFAEVVKAIRAGAAYANVHTGAHPGGEVRGALSIGD